MRTRGAETRAEILRVGATIVREGGPAKLTYDEIAARLGVTKQAVIYWFPNKEALISSLALPALQDETDVAVAALAAAPVGRVAALTAFARALIDFHLGDLDRFRLTYIAVQTPGSSVEPSTTLKASIHAITRPMYDALEERLKDQSEVQPRLSAVAVHMAILGFVLLISLADAVRDPLRHQTADLVAALIRLLTGGAAGPL